MDSLKWLGMDYLTGVAMPIHSLHHYLHKYHFMFPLWYLLQLCLCLYHHYVIGWLYLFQVYSFLQFQPVEILAATGITHLGNARQDVNNTLLPIVWYVAVAAGLGNVHPKWMALHCKTYWNWMRSSVHVRICDRASCNCLAKFMGGHKKNPDQHYFFENKTLFSLIGEVSQYNQDSFCDN